MTGLKHGRVYKPLKYHTHTLESAQISRNIYQYTRQAYSARKYFVRYILRAVTNRSILPLQIYQSYSSVTYHSTLPRGCTARRVIEQLKIGLCWRETGHGTTNTSQPHLTNEKYFNDSSITMKIPSQQTTTFLPPPRTETPPCREGTWFLLQTNIAQIYYGSSRTTVRFCRYFVQRRRVVLVHTTTQTSIAVKLMRPPDADVLPWASYDAQRPQERYSSRPKAIHMMASDPTNNVLAVPKNEDVQRPQKGRSSSPKQPMVCGDS